MSLCTDVQRIPPGGSSFFGRSQFLTRFLRIAVQFFLSEGFHSWMWRGLGFLLPFLFGGYVSVFFPRFERNFFPAGFGTIFMDSLVWFSSWQIFQLYNAYTLWQLSKDPRCHEWQVSICAIVFFILFLGNTVTTLLVVKTKFQQSLRAEAEKLRCAKPKATWVYSRAKLFQFITAHKNKTIFTKELLTIK